MKKHKLLVSLGFVSVFLICVLIMDYPFLARLINEQNQGEVVIGYQNAVESTADEKKEQLLLEAGEYNRFLASGLGEGIAGAAGEDTDAHQEYFSLLSAEKDGTMGMIEIPKIKVNLMIYHGTAEDVLLKGAGHLEGSSLPVGGSSTHSCISAHRGLVQKKMFTDLDELEEGDIFLIHVLGDTLCYRIENIQTVLPDEIQPLAIQRGRDMATLITCTPYGINTHRLYVQGVRIPYTEEVKTEMTEKEKAVRLRDWWWLLLSFLLLLFMIIILIRYLKASPADRADRS